MTTDCRRNRLGDYCMYTTYFFISIQENEIKIFTIPIIPNDVIGRLGDHPHGYK